MRSKRTVIALVEKFQGEQFEFERSDGSPHVDRILIAL
jgi:hypothetical protein